MFGKCRVCSEKERHIQALREQIEVLRSLALPSPIPGPDPFDGAPVANTTLMPAEEVAQAYAADSERKAREVELERDRLLSGV